VETVVIKTDEQLLQDWIETY